MFKVIYQPNGYILMLDTDTLLCSASEYAIVLQKSVFQCILTRHPAIVEPVLLAGCRVGSIELAYFLTY